MFQATGQSGFFNKFLGVPSSFPDTRSRSNTRHAIDSVHEEIHGRLGYELFGLEERGRNESEGPGSVSWSRNGVHPERPHRNVLPHAKAVTVVFRPGAVCVALKAPGRFSILARRSSSTVLPRVVRCGGLAKIGWFNHGTSSAAGTASSAQRRCSSVIGFRTGSASPVCLAGARQSRQPGS